MIKVYRIAYIECCPEKLECFTESKLFDIFNEGMTIFKRAL